MTVSDLIKALAELPLDARVVTAGFDEAGVEDVTAPKIVRVRFNVRLEGKHVGPHEQDDAGIEAVWIDW